MKPFTRTMGISSDKICNNPYCEKNCGKTHPKKELRNSKIDIAIFFTVMFLVSIISFNAGVSHLKMKYENKYEGYFLVHEKEYYSIRKKVADLEKENAELKNVRVEKTQTEEKKVEVEKQIVVNKGVLKKSNATEEMLRRGVHKELKNNVKAFLKAEEETGIDAYFLCALAGYESGWGTSPLARNNNNLFGYKGGKGYAKFKSKEECILFVAHKLKENYLTEGGKYFNGYEIKDIAIKYNHGSKVWIENVTVIRNQIKYRAES